MTPLEIAQDELDRVKVRDERTERFTQIKIGVPMVLMIVGHLKSGGSIYQLKQKRLAAVNTIRKVRDAWKAGKLDRVIEVAGLPEIQELLKNEPLTQSKSNALADARSALDDAYSAAFKKQWEWDLRHLQEIGVSAKEGLGILQRHDELYGAMQAAQTARRNAKGLETYISLHYQAVFSIQFPKTPFRYINTAAHIYTRGLLESERRREPLDIDGATSSGKDMLRYEIWEGDDHINAYFKALQRYKLSPHKIDDLKEQIARLKEKDNG